MKHVYDNVDLSLTVENKTITFATAQGGLNKTKTVALAQTSNKVFPLSEKDSDKGKR